MSQELRSPSSVLAYCRELDVKIICLRFTDFLGQLRSVRIPFSDLKEESFEYGFGLSVADIPCWGERDNGDMLLVPQTDSCFYDPFCPVPTLNLFCGLQDPMTRQDLAVDGRATTIKATAFMASCGFAERAIIGADIEFHLVAFPQPQYVLPSSVDLENGVGESGILSSDDLGIAQGIFVGHAVAPSRLQDTAAEEELTGNVVGEILRQLGACRVQVDSQRLRCPSGNWATVAVRAEDPVRAADSIATAKYIIQCVARRFGRAAFFLPRISPELRACGLPLNIGFLKSGDSLLGGSEYAGLNSFGLGAIGGLLRHLRSLCSLVSPSSDSYRRLTGDSLSGRGVQPAMFASYSRYDQRAAVRLPCFSASPRNKRIEFACCDATANPYVAISAVIMAMIDGAQNKLDPGSPLERLLDETGQIATNNEVPNSLEDALQALESDHDYLTRGGVFLSEFVESWLACKRQDNAYNRKIH